VLKPVSEDTVKDMPFGIVSDVDGGRIRTYAKTFDDLMKQADTIKAKGGKPPTLGTTKQTSLERNTAYQRELTQKAQEARDEGDEESAQMYEEQAKLTGDTLKKQSQFAPPKPFVSTITEKRPGVPATPEVPGKTNFLGRVTAPIPGTPEIPARTIRRPATAADLGNIPSPPPTAVAPQAARELDPETAKQLLLEARGDKELARSLARQRGYKF